MQTNNVPEITVEKLAENLKSKSSFILLDVRETWELDQAKIIDDRLEIVPMSRLAQEGIDALPDLIRSKDREIFVLCHHGVRSADITGWLVSQGWKNIYSVVGGIDEYARKIDRSVGVY